MKRCPLFVLIGLLVLLPSLARAQSDEKDVNDLEAKLREVVPAQTDAAALQIIDKHLQILGGTGRLKTISNTVSQGVKREGKNEVNLTVYRAAPDKLRIETSKSVMGRPETEIQGTDGSAFWTFRPNEKNALPAEMSAKEAARFKLEADFYGPLVDWQEKGYVFRYEGTVQSRRQKHYLLRMFYPNGLSQYFYFDAKTLMVTRVGQETILGKTIVNQDTYYTRYERIDGVWMPTQMEFALEDQVYGHLKFSRIEANQPLPAELFGLPKVREVWLRKEGVSIRQQ